MPNNTDTSTRGCRKWCSPASTFGTNFPAATASCVLPRLVEFQRAVAQVVFRMPARLGGPKVGFLRWQPGRSDADFARHVGVDPSAVPNWETDKEPIGPSSDRAPRHMAAHARPVEEYPLHELTKMGNHRWPSIDTRIAPKGRGCDGVAA
jgi:hypothetical protein